MSTPLQLKNTASRLGVAAACAAALRGENVSRKGSAMLTPPTPRRKFRRFILRPISSLLGT
jgi:hypothetical protein